MKVLVVDDSIVYRSRIKAALNGASGIDVIGTASNGKIALEMLAQTPADLVTLDMEMPIMGGLETLRALRRIDRKTKVIVFSSSTIQGSAATLEALASGADDFVAKPSGDSVGPTDPEDYIRRDLLPKIMQFFKSVDVPPSRADKAHGGSQKVYVRKELLVFQPAAIVIASSTGGPSAHDAIFNELGGKLRCPILIAQHMPPVFTTSFAKRIASMSGLPCREAVHGQVVTNEIYVAPGDFHLTVRREAGRVTMALDQAAPRNFVRPAADHLFETAATVYGKQCMGFVLTGMGEDGLAGSKAIKAAEGGVMIQNAESCVVFGMPGSVHAAGAFDGSGSLEEIRATLKRMALE